MTMTQKRDRAEYNRRWHVENAERVRERKRRWYLKNIEKAREYGRAWRAERAKGVTASRRAQS